MKSNSFANIKAPESIEGRDWIVADENSKDANKYPANFDPTQDKQKYIAEVLHIIRPICHCNYILITFDN